jgi:hypothetical protein
MPRLLVLVAVFLAAAPVRAQWGGGDGAQAGATAYCAARAAGKDHKQASRAASSALSTSMTGGFAANIATIIVGGRNMWQSVYYLAKQQCPQYAQHSGVQLDSLNPDGVDWMQKGSSAYYSDPGAEAPPSEEPHDKCLRAADYAGCMKFQMSE